MTDTATLQARLTEAETALHKLVMGSKEVTVSYDGKSVTFAQTDESRLRSYIAELNSKLGTGGRRKSLSPVFGD